MSLFGRKNNSLLGIDITNTSVKLLELARQGNQYRVESYAVEPLPANAVVERNITDPQQVGETISQALKRSGTKTRIAACAVSGSATITKIIGMSADLSDEEMEGQIRVEADQYIPYALDEVSMDFEVLGPRPEEPGKVDVLLAASRNDNVDVRKAALEFAGLSAKVIDIEAFALENAVNFIALHNGLASPDSTVAVVDIGATITSVNIIRDRKIIYTREQLFGGRQLTEEIQRNYGLSFAEAGLAKRQGGLPDNYGPELLEPFKETMTLEINRALQFFYASHHQSVVNQILLAGGCAAISGISELVEARTGIPVSIANPFVGMPFVSKVKAEVVQNDAPAMMIAFGLALRRFD